VADTMDVREAADEQAEEAALAAAAEEEFEPSPGGWAARIGFAALLVAFVFSLPVVVRFEYQADLVALVAIFGCAALSMNVLTGYLGQLSLGHQAFYGIGAFASALIVSNIGLPFLAGLAVASLTGALSAVLIGYVALRVKGLYLAIVTLAYGLLAENTIFQIGLLSAGVPTERPAGFESPRTYAYICLFTLALLFAIDWRLLKSKAGRAIQAIRDDERVAAAYGINITNYKLLAFIISGTFAGLAGGLFAHQLGTVSAENQFDLFLALTFVMMTVIGGLGNRVGVILGAVFFTALGDILAAITPGEPNPVLSPVIGAALLLVVLIFFPGGIGQLISPIQNWVRGGRFKLGAIRKYESFGGGMVGRP
jgi:branched-chain amino acid transport system permease protein